MNFADLQKTWASPHNHPSAAELEAQKARFVRKLVGQRRGFFVFMAFPIAAMSVMTALVGWRAFGPGSSSSLEEWAVPLLLALPWAVIVILIRQQLAHHRRHADYRESIPRSLRALLDANRRAQSRTTMILWAHLASLPLLALVIGQLEAAGKVRPHELRSMIGFFGAVIVVSVIGLLIVRARKLRPEQARLQELLRDYEEAEARSGGVSGVSGDSANGG
ncbi:MAG: hypothetical protein H7067_17375 [Burkholderiales bacterium]|nr:hypothetical protein [Opitutaceae bacterium]